MQNILEDYAALVSALMKSLANDVVAEYIPFPSSYGLPQVKTLCIVASTECQILSRRNVIVLFLTFQNCKEIHPAAGADGTAQFLAEDE